VAYELIELGPGNVIGVYATQDAALHDVAAAVRSGGFDSIATQAFMVDDPTGATDGAIVADGRALTDRASNQPGTAAA
jgi:hypothetical protein